MTGWSFIIICYLPCWLLSSKKTKEKVGRRAATFAPTGKEMTQRLNQHAGKSLLPTSLQKLSAHMEKSLGDMPLSQDMQNLVKAGNDPRQLNKVAHTATSQTVLNVAGHRLAATAARPNHKAMAVAAAQHSPVLKNADKSAPTPPHAMIARVSTVTPELQKAKAANNSAFAQPRVAQRPKAKTWAGMIVAHNFVMA